jgi:hypothetical protein
MQKASLKAIDSKVLNSEYSTEELKSMIMFHSLYSEYRKDIALTIKEYITEIKEGILASNPSAQTYSLIKHLSNIVLPESTRELVNNMLKELHESKLELFKEPDCLKVISQNQSNKGEVSKEVGYKASKEEEDDSTSIKIKISENKLEEFIQESVVLAEGNQLDIAIERSLAGTDSNYDIDKSGME